MVFMCGSTLKVSISYEPVDWALQKAFVAAVKHEPAIGVVNIENARLDRAEIASAFLERFITDPDPLLYSPGTGDPVRRANDLVEAMTTNFGTLCEDLLNRALPVHLNPVGNVADRNSAIGNPKLEYLPANRELIEAELRGMVERWKQAGKPLDTDVKHPFTEWARVIGGILKVNGFTDFLANYPERRTVDDPLKQALGLLGAFRPGVWLPASTWAGIVAHLGLTKTLISPSNRESVESRWRGLGVVLTKHREETFIAETDDQILTLRLEKSRRRFDGGEPQTRYRFVVLDQKILTEDSAE